MKAVRTRTHGRVIDPRCVGSPDGSPGNLALMAALRDLVWIYVFLQPLASENSILPKRCGDLVQSAVEVILRYSWRQDLGDALEDWLVVSVVVSGLVNRVRVSRFVLCNHFVKSCFDRCECVECLL